MHQGYVFAHLGGLLYGEGLRWFEGREKKGTPVLGEIAGEELVSSILLSKYSEAYKCDICNTVFIYISRIAGKNSEDGLCRYQISGVRTQRMKSSPNRNDPCALLI